MDINVVILAGGRGQRFWPLSRNQRPKQLLRLLGEETLLESTLRRVAQRVPPGRTWIVAGVDLKPALDTLGLPLPDDRFLWEPVGRNTAAAIGAAAERILSEDDGDLLVLPSDHWISDAGPFWEAVETGRALLERETFLVTFGIPPVYAETGYGYVERGRALDGIPQAWNVARFHEKPDLEHAAAYVRSGCCYWNSGIFLFRASVVAEALRRYIPEMAAALDRLRSDLRAGAGPETWRRYFEAAPSVSIDHGVMEKADKVAVVEAHFDWTDLGNWTSVGEHLPADAQGNRTRGAVMALESEECVLLSEDEGLLAVLGLKDLIVVRVGDATLVCPKDRAQEVRRLVQEGLKDERLRRYFES